MDTTENNDRGPLATVLFRHLEQYYNNREDNNREEEQEDARKVQAVREQGTGERAQ